MTRVVIAVAVCVFGSSVFAQSVSYTSNIKPIFEKYGCTGCHGGEQNLFLDTYQKLMTTGNSSPVVVPFDTNSVLVKRLKGDGVARMPLGSNAIDGNDLNTVIAWIKAGAPENTTSVEEIPNVNVIRTFDLKQNYPNPFNPTTQIHFSVPTNGNATLAIYDALGRQVMVLLNQYFAAGSYSYNFNATSLPSGIYYYRLQTGNNTATKKLVLTK